MGRKDETMIGVAGGWLAERLPDPPPLSFRHPQWSDLESWRTEAVGRVYGLLALPGDPARPVARVLERGETEGLAFERLSWALPYGPPTEALFLKPAGSSERLPGVLALHDHGGRKFFGWQKITRGGTPLHPIVAEHQEHSYGGRAWANELARRGYGVLIHDVFPFGSRRVRYAEVPAEIRELGRTSTIGGGHPESIEAEPATIEELIEYDRWAAAHESIVAKSLFALGTTWPGLFLYEDQAALSYLSGREDIDSERIGCGGLSGGGMRTDYLAGVDGRLRAAVSVGFMTTWRDFALSRSWTHTWMAYTPGLPLSLDLPDLLSLRAPMPTMVLSCADDALFTLAEMRRAGSALEEVYAKAGSPDCLDVRFFPGGHRFDREMQETAFDFFDRWLKG